MPCKTPLPETKDILRREASQISFWHDNSKGPKHPGHFTASSREDGTLLTNPKDINDHFHSELYTSNSNATHPDLNEMPKLTLPGKT